MTVTLIRETYPDPNGERVTETLMERTAAECKCLPACVAAELGRIVAPPTNAEIVAQLPQRDRSDGDSCKAISMSRRCVALSPPQSSSVTRGPSCR